MSRESTKRTHVAARPVTPEPMTATRIVPTMSKYKLCGKSHSKVQWVFVKQHRNLDIVLYLESKKQYGDLGDLTYVSFNTS